MRGLGRACALVAAVSCLVAPPEASADPLGRPKSAVREIVGERTAHSTTWATRDGKRVTRVAAERVRWKDARGRWRPYDLGLDATGGGYIADAGPARVALPTRIEDGGGAVSLSHGGHTISSWLEGAASAAADVDGALATYDHAKPGVDVRLQVVPDGVKEDLVVARPEAARQLSYRLKLTDGLSAGIERSGDVAVRDGSGRAIFTVPAAVVSDSAPAPAYAPAPSYRLDALGGGEYRLSLTLDQRWLRDEECRWPVIVDPTTITSRLAATQCILQSRVFWFGSQEQFVREQSAPDCGNPRRPTTQVGGLWYPSDQDYTQIDTTLAFPSLAGLLAQTDTVDSARLTLHAETQANPVPLLVMGNGRRAALAENATILASSGRQVTANVLNIVSAWQENRSDTTRGFPQAPLRLTGQSRDSLFNLAAGRFAEECQPSYGGGVLDCPTGTTTLATATNPDSAKRPYLEIVSIPRAPDGRMLSPAEGASTGRRVTLQARGGGLVRSMRFQYVAGDSRDWQDIPTAALRFVDPVGGSTAVTSAEIPVARATSGSGVVSKELVWDLQATPGGGLDGSVHVRAILDDATFVDGGATKVVNFRLDRRNPVVSSTAEIGPGMVDLLTGDLTLSTSDVEVGGWLSSLGVSRTFHSRGVSPRDAEMFGPQWAASFEADGGRMPYKRLYNYSEIDEETVVDWIQEPVTYGFDMQVDMPSSAYCIEFPDDNLEWQLECEEIPNNPLDVYREFTVDQWTPVTDIVRWQYDYSVVELDDGGKLTFRRVSNDRGVSGNWEPDAANPGYAIERAGQDGWTLTDAGGNRTTFARDAVESPSYHPTAYRQAGSAQTPTFAWQSVDGRLRLTRVHAAALDSSAEAARYLRFNWARDSTTGDQPRVKSISFGRYDSAASAVTELLVAGYTYDSSARLIEAYDPRVASGLATRYTYDAENRVTTITPPGEATWRLAYRLSSGDGNPGRLQSVTRFSPGNGDATWRVVYDVPLSGSGAPADMSATTLAQWGQTEDVPVDATAVLLPSAAGRNGWEGATVHYLDVRGREVNTRYADGSLDMTQYDDWGNAKRELTAANRERALADPDPIERAALLSTLNGYDDAGVNLVSTLGPLRRLTLRETGQAVTGRTRILREYDDGKPDATVYNLVTSQSQHALYLDGDEWRTGDVELTEFDYSGGGLTTLNRGWQVRQPTRAVVDPGGLALTTTTVFDERLPLVRESRMPADRGTGTRRTRFFYYGVDGSACGSAPPTYHAARAGLVCRTVTDVAAGDTPVPTTSTGYDSDWNTTSVTESTPSTTRTTTTTYDGAGRPVTKSVSGPGEPVPAITTSYHAQTGRPVSQTSSAVGTTPSRTINQSYDALGRISSYTDATGAVTSSTYDIDGNLVVQTDQNGRTFYEHDARGLVVAVDDTVLGEPITAERDADGNVVSQTLPNGLVRETTYDPAGAAVSLTVAKSDCRANCVWLSQQLSHDAHGRWLKETTDGERRRELSFDAAGRIDVVRDTRASGCTTRVYRYDGNSNRTSRAVHPAAGDGGCSTATSPATQALTYDSADRALTSNGASFAYDTFGRATTVPANAVGIGSTLFAGYAADDLVQGLQQGDRSVSIQRDPSRRTLTRATTERGVTATETNHFADGSDAPSWSATSATEWTRYVAGPDDDLAVSVDQDGTAVYAIADLHGDVVATASDSPSATAPTARFSFDEFGVPTGGAAGRYGWLGAEQRSTEMPSGVMEMGARVYVPSLGRFLQRDSVAGGSANAYDYVSQNPVTQFDLAGTWCPPWAIAIARVVGAVLLKEGAKQATKRGATKTAEKLAARSSRNIGKAEAVLRKNETQITNYLFEFGRSHKDGSMWLPFKRRGVSGRFSLEPPHPGGPHSKYPHLQVNGWMRGRSGSGVRAGHDIKPRRGSR